MDANQVLVSICMQIGTLMIQANDIRLYMADGIYQSVICFFMAYLVFYNGTFESWNGRGINDSKRIGIYVGLLRVYD